LSPIELRIIYRNERKDIYTGLYCDIDSWDNVSGRVKSNCKQAATINKNLELINHQALYDISVMNKPVYADDLNRYGFNFSLSSLTGCLFCEIS